MKTYFVRYYSLKGEPMARSFKMSELEEKDRFVELMKRTERFIEEYEHEW